MNKNNTNIDKEYISYLKDSEEHGFEDYTDNVVKQKVITTFGGGCGCSGAKDKKSGGCGGNCGCGKKK